MVSSDLTFHDRRESKYIMSRLFQVLAGYVGDQHRAVDVCLAPGWSVVGVMPNVASNSSLLAGGWLDLDTLYLCQRRCLHGG